jgi:hypothetical protein
MILTPFAAPWVAAAIAAPARSSAIMSWRARGSGSPLRSAQRASGCISAPRANLSGSGRGPRTLSSCR